MDLGLLFAAMVLSASIVCGVEPAEVSDPTGLTDGAVVSARDGLGGASAWMSAIFVDPVMIWLTHHATRGLERRARRPSRATP